MEQQSGFESVAFCAVKRTPMIPKRTENIRNENPDFSATRETAAAVSGSETSIPGFGKFKVKDTPEREARNPATGQTIKVAAAKKLNFAPAKALKDALNR
jgi:hypothetical protein